MRPAGLCVFVLNGECMVRGVIGGRSESRPRVPGVRFKVELVGLVKFTKWKSFCCWWGSRLDPYLEGCRSPVDGLGAWLRKVSIAEWVPRAPGMSAVVGQGSMGGRVR